MRSKLWDPGSEGSEGVVVVDWSTALVASACLMLELWFDVAVLADGSMCSGAEAFHTPHPIAPAARQPVATKATKLRALVLTDEAPQVIYSTNNCYIVCGFNEVTSTFALIG
ncbi:hypothetical protein [Corynebacterium epidermidicanis]|uniref:hypothetical protein n=1 Tax=Corynebacterium epidermidicanis TaxID=1050174 RepID=UPI000640E1AE|nr:hypothetical protein [Corynebacterium epidermidicanis]